MPLRPDEPHQSSGLPTDAFGPHERNVIRFAHCSTTHADRENASVIDHVVTVLQVLLSDVDVATQLVQAGCEPVEVQTLLANMHVLPRFALCIACVKNGLTDPRYAILLSERLRKNDYPKPFDPSSPYVMARALRTLLARMSTRGSDGRPRAREFSNGQAPGRPSGR